MINDNHNNLWECQLEKYYDTCEDGKNRTKIFM